MLSVALDTCLLVELNDWGRGTEEEHVPLELVSDLSTLLRSGRAELLLDNAGKIRSEYHRHLKDFDLGHRLLRSAERSGGIVWRSDHLSAKTTHHLDADGFDPADYPFLAVCHKVDGIYGTTEEKHLLPARRKLVARICKVSILSLPELHERCSKIRELG